MKSAYAFQWARLHTNDGLYWGGYPEQGGLGWTETPCCFALPLKYEKKKKAFGTDIEIENNISWTQYLDMEGYAIPMPHKDLSQEVRLYSFQFDLMKPFGVCKNRITRGTILKDFKIEIGTSSYMNSISTTDDSDTEYTNIINEKAVEEYDDIEFKVTTWDGKELNYSSVFYNEKFLENGYQISANSEGMELRRLETIYDRSNGMILRPEEMKIYNIIAQYKEPAVILNICLDNNIKPYSTVQYHFFKDKVFVVNSMSINYRFNNVQLNLIEKK